MRFLKRKGFCASLAKSTVFFSKKITICFMLCLVVMMGGCHSTSTPLSALQVEEQEVEKKQTTFKQHASQTHAYVDNENNQNAEIASQPLQLSSDEKKSYPAKVASSIREGFKSNHEFYRTVDEIANNRSIQCRRILAQAGIKSAILRSPTLTADVNSDGDLGAGINYDFVDLKRANLQEELALARCVKAVNSVKLGQLLVGVQPYVERQRYLATAHYLKKHRGTLRRIEKAIARGVNAGEFTILAAGQLRQYLARVKNEEKIQKNQAAQLVVAEKIHNKSFAQLDQKILAVEKRIHDIQARMRTVDAFSLTGNVKYGQPSNSDDAFTYNQSDSDVSATVKLSVRLGAFSKRRYALERQLRADSHRQFFDPDGGRLWQSQQLAKASQESLRILQKERQGIQQAIAQTKVSARIEINEALVDLLPVKLRGLIDKVSLGAQLAGTNAAINATKAVHRKLIYRQ